MVSFMLSHLLAEGDDFTSALELARFCWQFSRTNVQKGEKTSLRVHDFKLKSQSILSRGFFVLDTSVNFVTIRLTSLEEIVILVGEFTAILGNETSECRRTESLWRVRS